MSQLACVVVTFNPDLDYFKTVIAKILKNEVLIYIVDNGSENINDWSSYLSPSIVLISLEENVGIARAQNIGIQRAFNCLWHDYT